MFKSLQKILRGKNDGAKQVSQESPRFLDEQYLKDTLSRYGVDYLNLQDPADAIKMAMEIEEKGGMFLDGVVLVMWRKRPGESEEMGEFNEVTVGHQLFKQFPTGEKSRMQNYCLAAIRWGRPELRKAYQEYLYQI